MSILILIPGFIEAQTTEGGSWPELVKRCESYRTEGNITERFGQWVDDVLLLKDYAIAGKKKAYHELFLMTLYSDGGLVDALGLLLTELHKANPKFFDRLLKKESKEVQEQVAWHQKAALDESGDGS